MRKVLGLSLGFTAVAGAAAAHPGHAPEAAGLAHFLAEHAGAAAPVVIATAALAAIIIAATRSASR